MAWTWRLTAKRRENLVKVCLSAFTADLAGLVIPFALKAEPLHGSILSLGVLVGLILCVVIYLLET